MGENQANDEEAGEAFFNPPLYKQRYSITTSILKDARWADDIKKVVEFGCAELSMVLYLKSLPHLRQIVEVDIDGPLLDSYKFRARPLTFEYLKRRSQPLTIDVYKGSVADCDKSLVDTDAVICIELIEHLYPDVLEKVPSTIFGFIQPLVVVITTPNAEFNVLFKDLTGFRHWDHKFEWTRSEFNNWSKSIVEKYPNYTYELTGVGDPPEGSERLGHCSQIAVFHRQSKVSTSQVPEELYELMERVEYPYDEDQRSEDQKIADEITYRVNTLSREERYHLPYEDIAVVPFNILLPLVQERYPNCSEDRFWDIAAEKFSIQCENGESSIRWNLHCDSSEGDEDDFDDLIPQSSFTADQTIQEEEENWDDPTEKPATIENQDKEGEGDDPNPADVVLVDLPPYNEQEAARIREAIQENEANQLTESLRNHGLLLPPPAGFFDDNDDDDEELHFNVDDDGDDDLDYDCFDGDGFDCDALRFRNDDCEWMDGHESSNETTEPVSKPKTDDRTADSGLELSPRLHNSDFPKSVSIEVLHHDGPSSQARPTRIEYGDSMALCYTGQDRQSSRLADSPAADSCSLDEPDRAADSGYPNSSSLHHEADVDADLTPEQVDDISRSEDDEPSLSDDAHSNASEGEGRPIEARPPAREARLPLPVFANVENGDLANNNRDGEGNNAAPEDIPGLPLEFAAVVHGEEQQPLLAGAEPAPPQRNEEEDVLPEHADPFPPWLTDLLGLDHSHRGAGDDSTALSDTDEGLGDENAHSWTGDGPTDFAVNRSPNG